MKQYCVSRILIWFVLSTLLVLAQVTFILKLVVHAAPPPSAWTAWASDAPTIDGFLSPMSVVMGHAHRAEWEDAAKGDIWFWWDGANHKCTLYVMNDDVNLYVAFEIRDEDYDPDDFLWVNFDNSHDHSNCTAGDDVLILFAEDSNVDTYAGTFWDQVWDAPDVRMADSSVGGSGDGVGACKFTGATLTGTYVFEFAHPLNSGDDFHDFSLQAGDTVGFNVLYMDAPYGLDHEAGWPVLTTDDWSQMSDIEIAPNPSIVGDVPPLNLRIPQVEITQAIQWLNDPGHVDNSVPLVRGKSTVVRVYVDVELSGVPIPNVEVFLHATFMDKTRAKPVVGAKAARANGPLRESFTAPVVPNRGNVEHTANFLLPDYWVESGHVALDAFVKAPAGRSETNYSDNWISTEKFYFATANPLKIGYYEIDYRPTAPGGSENLPGDVSTYHHRLYEKIYPTPDLSDPTEYVPLGTFSWPAGRNLNLGAWPNYERNITAEVDLLKALRLLYVLHFLIDPELDQLVGWLPANSRLKIAGRAGAGAPLGDGRKVVTFIKYPNWDSLPHEIGHNLHGPHAWDNSSGNPWLDEPTENQTQTYGFDTWRPFEVKDPTCGEMMSYLRPRWIAPWQWTFLLETLDPPAGFSASQEDAQAKTLSSSPGLWVSGTIHKDQTSSLDPVFQVSTFLNTTPPTGPYAIELRGAPPAEPLLYSQSFNVSFEDCHEGFIDVSSFMLELPFMTGTYSVSLWNTSVSPPILLDKITASSSPPQVTVTYPNGGETVGDSFNATWTATDIDGDPLTYILLYSSDSGTTWRPLATYVQGTSYRVNASLLPGGAQSMIRVVASDGFHTSEDQSDTVFYVPLKGPLNVVGNSGSNVTIFREPVSFRGSAFDPEDGLLQDSALSWTSDLDGALGTGKVLAVADLSPGIHNITLTATDSHSNNATDSFTVTVRLHNIKVAEVTADPVSIYEGQPVKINVCVTLKNEGNEAEGFNVHAYLISEDPSIPDLSIWNQSVTGLPSNSNITFTFSWNTTDSIAGNYTIVCLTDPVPRELYTGDNYLATHVHVKIVGDINGDRKVDIKDLAFIAIRYGALQGDPIYDPLADITGVKYLVPDAKIDIRDLALTAIHYGEIG